MRIHVISIDDGLDDGIVDEISGNQEMFLITLNAISLADFTLRSRRGEN